MSQQTPRMEAACKRAMDKNNNGPNFLECLAEEYRIEGRSLECELFIQTEAAKALGRIVADKDADRIFFRDECARLAQEKAELVRALELAKSRIGDYWGGLPVDDWRQVLEQIRAVLAKAKP